MLTAKFNMIEETFHGLRILYTQSPHIVTATEMFNQLLSNTESDCQLCASVFPVKCLEYLCGQCMTLMALRVSCHIVTCKFLLPI